MAGEVVLQILDSVRHVKRTIDGKQTYCEANELVSLVEPEAACNFWSVWF